jgi:hypothetical protein
MSRNIDLTKRLDEDELRYLVDRDRWDDLRTNADNLGIEAPNLPSARGIRAQVPRRQLQHNEEFNRIADMMGVPVADEDGFVPSANKGPEPVDYNKLTLPQLKEALDARRKQYEATGDTEGVADVSYEAKATKAELVLKLQADDEAVSDN